jgi:hypothetical protein
MSFPSRNEIETALRREATRRGETILAVTWNGDNPTVTLDKRDRSTEDIAKVGKDIFRDAFQPLLQAATAKALRDAFRR